MGLQQASKKVGRRIEKLGDRPGAGVANDTFSGAAGRNHDRRDGTGQSPVGGSLGPDGRQRFAGRLAVPERRSQVCDKNAHVIIAFDLTDVISPEAATARLQKYESVQASDAESLAADVSKLRGITLGLTLATRSRLAELDFAPGTTNLAKIDKALLLEALERNGVMIDDVRDWELSVSRIRLC